MAQAYQTNHRGQRVDREVTRLYYDGLGRRLAKEYDPKAGAGGVKRTEYVFDGLDPVVEYSLWNGQRDEFYRGGLEAFSPTPMLLEMRNFPAGAEGQAYWYHLDGRGSVAGLTKHQGQSTHNYRYDAYGQLLPAHGNWTDPHNHYTFAGKEWDEHLGLYEFGYRLYDPWAGIWLTREPMRGRAWAPRTWHRYQYAYASPISYYDPYGLQTPPPPQPAPTPPPYTPTYGPTSTPGPSPTPTATPAPQPRPTPPIPTSTPTPTGAQCSPELPLSHWWSDRQRIANVLSKTALTLDAIALLLSGVEAGITDISAVILVAGFAALGAGAEGVGAGPGALAGLEIAWALDVAIARYSPIGTAENMLGGAALLATIGSDLAGGYTGFTEEGFAIGQDTLVSARNMLLGFIPESNIDLAISASQFHYDIERNFMGRPGGSVVFTSPTDWEAWKRLFRVLLEEW